MMNLYKNKNKMDKALIDSSYYFVKEYVNKNENTLNDFINEMINNDIDINFDSSEFNLFGPKSIIKLTISEKTPILLLKEILKAIEDNDMSDTIRNSNNKIHFRTFKKKYLLDCELDLIRKELILCLSFFYYHENILNCLVKKMLETVNEIKNNQTDETRMCRLSVRKNRIKRLITIL